jgi:hypothetical protein
MSSVSLLTTKMRSFYQMYMRQALLRPFGVPRRDPKIPQMDLDQDCKKHVPRFRRGCRGTMKPPVQPCERRSGIARDTGLNVTTRDLSSSPARTLFSRLWNIPSLSPVHSTPHDISSGFRISFRVFHAQLVRRLGEKHRAVVLFTYGPVRSVETLGESLISRTTYTSLDSATFAVIRIVKRSFWVGPRPL